MSPKLFPSILIILDFFAALGYAFALDWYRVGYWVFAAGITFCATFGGVK
jgi:hypothetical protein